MPLVVKPSPIHSTGCYTTSFIPQGTFVVEYTGPRCALHVVAHPPGPDKTATLGALLLAYRREFTYTLPH